MYSGCMDSDTFSTAVDLLRRAEHLVALTGAGISTGSGIPDFRSPASGLWERYNPAEVDIYDWFQYGTGHRGDGDGDGLACE